MRQESAPGKVEILEETEGSGAHGGGMVSQNSRCGRMWVAMAQETDGAVWEDE